MGRQSKYIMSRMSRHLHDKVGLRETTPIRLSCVLNTPYVMTLDPTIIYINKDKTRGLTYIEHNFSIVTQNDAVTFRTNGTIYAIKNITHKEGIEMLNMMVRMEKLKKIKKKING
jgi:hypothetical protein